MDDGDKPRDDLPGISGPDRATTVVVRCWREHDSSGAALLRGTVRDLSRGRASAFEGFAGLAEQLQQIIGNDGSRRKP